MVLLADAVYEGTEGDAVPSNHSGESPSPAYALGPAIEECRNVTLPFRELTGAAAHASMTDAMLSNRFIRPARGNTRAGTVVAFAALVGLMATLLPYVAAIGGTAIAAAAWTWYAAWAFESGLWVNMAQPPGAMGAALAIAPATFLSRMKKFSKLRG